MTVWNFYFQIFEKAVGKEETILFLTHLLRYIKTPLLVVWDRLPAHRSRLVGEFLDSVNGQIAIEYLPPYAPELNPVEYLWGHWKHHTLPNVLSQGLMATQRRRATNPAPTSPQTASHYGLLETVLLADRLSYIMRTSVRRTNFVAEQLSWSQHNVQV